MCAALALLAIGSGKTFTITGGPEKYEDRGIIPRTLSHIFNEFRKRSDYSYQMHVSYLEIYNDSGYDLLDPSLEDNAKALEDLPKVALQEDEDGNIHLRNLSAHQVSSLACLYAGLYALSLVLAIHALQLFRVIYALPLVLTTCALTTCTCATAGRARRRRSLCSPLVLIIYASSLVRTIYAP